MIVFFDCETTGLPKDWQAPVENTENWPRLVQLAWLVYDLAENKILEKNYLIKPVDFEIPLSATNIHRITQEQALESGLLVEEVLKKFKADVDQAEFLVAHNIDFDEKIIKAELIRAEMDNFIDQKKKICTMLASKDYCQLKNRSGIGYKLPTLGELHYKLFEELFTDAHDAQVDTQILAKCFFELKKIKVIDLFKDFSTTEIKPEPEEKNQGSLF